MAFTDFLRHMPPDSGLAFVLVQHLDPRHPSLLPELLAGHTAMPVRHAVDQTSVAPNHVYLIPPNSALSIAGGVLRLGPPTEAHGQRLPIDHFFRSLAQDQGPRATGVVLSGSGADGTEGLAAIQAAGGLTLAQTPASAGAPGMPEQSIARGVADHVLDVAAMPALLLARVRPEGQPGLSPAHPRETGAQDAPAPDADPLGVIITLLQRTTGHDFSHYKRPTLQRRIERRIQLLHLDSLEAYHKRLRENQGELEQLFQDLLISVTEFFRDPAAFDALAAVALATLLQGRRSDMPLRVWVAGCATGEEAYSIAILLQELLAQLDAPPSVQIFATDIDEPALAVARRGVSDAGIAAHLTPERLARWFVPSGQGYQVSKALRERCLFSVHNPISDPPFGRMDLIACRNLLIYFDAELQRQLLPLFHYALVPRGFLFLGSAESTTGPAGGSELFQAVDAPNRTFQRKERLVHPRLELPWATAGRQLSRQASAAQRAVPPGGLGLGATLEHVLLRDYAPTAVAIDEQGAIVHLHGRTSPYLVVPAGAPTTNLLVLAHPDLQLPLRAAIRAAIQGQQQVIREELALRTGEGLQRLTLTVQPLAEPGTAGMLLVVLQALGPPAPLSPPDPAADASSSATRAMVDELQRTRDSLEATLGEFQEANFDLTAANEELQTSKEELQSINEELQTVNEELQTVNAELKRKIEELDRVNADLANLFASAQIPAIFLGIEGRIARFTPHATELFALRDSDVGRPIGDFQARFSIGELPRQIDQVLRTQASAELVVLRPEQDRWWNVQLRPYRTLSGDVEGVVLTFSDITALKRAEAVLQGAHDELERRVAARNAELAVANAALQAQVAERVESEQARQQLLQQLVTAQEEERRHIARELHDQLAQDLTGLILGLKALHDSAPAGDQSAERIAQLQAVAVGIGREVRDLAVRLRPSVLDDLGLALALSNYVEQWSARANVGLDLHTSGLDGERLPLAVETTLYRLVQEALTNVLKHAQASEVSVIIERNMDEVRLIVEDDGGGFSAPLASGEPDATPRLGLLGMQERVALLNGTLTVESASGSGTTLFARLPLAGA